MGQFDKLNDDKEIISTSVENTGDSSVENNKITESVPAPSTEELQDKEVEKAENKVADQARIDKIRDEIINGKESNETNFMTKKYSSANEGLNGLAGLYKDFPSIKGNKMFDESLPYLSLQTPDGEKYIVQKNPTMGFYIEGSADDKPQTFINIKLMAEKMGRDVESLTAELDNLIK